MARYVYACPGQPGDAESHELERFYPMGQAPQIEWCDDHMHNAPRTFDFQFQEDKRRMRSGRSNTTGQHYATSRADERRIEKEKGIEFIGPSEVPDKWRRAKEYAEHVKTGGDRDPKTEHAIAADPPHKGLTIKQAMDRRNVRLPS